MNFANTKKLKLQEIKSIDDKINEMKNDQMRTRNTDSVIPLIYERKSKMQELMQIFAAEESEEARLNQRDGRILDGLLDQHADNIHGEQAHII